MPNIVTEKTHCICAFVFVVCVTVPVVVDGYGWSFVMQQSNADWKNGAQ